MGPKKNNHGRNHSCKGSNLMTLEELPKWLNILQEASMISSTSGPWAWTQSSRSTPTSSMYNLPFSFRFDKGLSVESFTWWNTRWVWLVKTSEFTHIKEGIGSTRHGIVETYTTSFNSKYHQLENRAWLRKQRIQFAKSIMYPRKDSQVIEYEGHCRILSQQRMWRSKTELRWVSVLNQRKKECKGIRLWQYLNTLMF